MVVDQNVSFLYFVDVWTLLLPDYTFLLSLLIAWKLYSLPINSNTYRLDKDKVV